MHKVLFVDDEQMVLNSIRRALRSMPFAIETALSGKDALNKLKTIEISVVVSDMCMPIMDGNEFLDHAQKICPDAIYMVLSAYSDIENVMKAVNKQHVWRYITKPWQKEDLVLAVKNAIEVFEYREAKKDLLIRLEEKNRQLNELNSILEERVRERTLQLQSKNEILQMLVEDVDIKKILKKLCKAISIQLQVSSVFINIPFQNKTISNSSKKLNSNLKKILNECNYEKKEIMRKTAFGIPLIKKDLYLGTILIENDSGINEFRLVDKDRSFISTAIICLSQTWNIHKVDKLMDELN